MKVALIGTTAQCVLGFRADLISALVADGKKVYAFALDYTEASRKQVESLGATPIDYQFSRSGLNLVADLLNTFKLAAKLKKIAPDLVLSYFSKPVIFGTFAAFLAGVERRVGMLEGLGHVFTTGPQGVSIKRRWLKRVQICLYRLCFPLLERLIVLNQDDLAELCEKHKLKVKKASVLGGIGLRLCDYPYSLPTTAPVTFIFVGRLLAEKGINDYVSAARLVKARYPTARFVILGGIDVSNPGGLSSLAAKQLVHDGIVAHPGHVDNVTDWIAAASVFVLPSYYREGVPRSTQEAMAIGRPIITTDMPGCRDTVVEGENGFLVPPWSPECLAERMVYFLEQPDRIVSMGLASYTIARDRFDESKINRQLLEYLT